MPLDPEQITKWLREGVNRKDIGKAVIPELGYSVTLIFDSDDSFITLRINCGVYSPWVTNVCAIEFPTKGRTADRILQSDTMIRIAKSTINSWNPDHGVITSHQCSDLLSPKTSLSEAGWVTYLSGKHRRLSEAPKQLRIEDVGDGRLFIATSERFSSRNSDHMKSVFALSTVLVSDDTAVL